MSKSVIGYLNELLSLVWKIGGLVLILSVVVLWAYLRDLGWLSIFLESVVSLSGFMAVVFVVSLLTLSVVLLYVAAGAVLIASLSFLDENPLPKILWLSVLSTIFSWFLIFLLVGLEVQLLLIWILVGANFFVYSFVFWKIKDRICLYFPDGFVGPPRKWNIYSRILFFGACHFILLACSVLVSVYPSLIAMDYFREISDASDLGMGFGFVFFVCLPGLVGLFPGLAVLQHRTRGGNKKTGFSVAVAACALVVFLLMVIILHSGYGGFLMRKVGVVSNDRASYLIMDEKLSSVFEKAGIPVRSQGEDRFISAYLRYGVGEVRLLCREKYDFQDALQPKNRRAGVRSSSVGGACVAVLAPDVREFKDALVCGRSSICSP